MSRSISINFYGFWKGFAPHEFLKHQTYLQPHYSFELSDDPEFAICGVFPEQRIVPSSAVKIFFTGENVTPDLRKYDWAVSHSHLDASTFGHDRHLRLPLYAWNLRWFNGGLGALVRSPTEQPGLDRTGFCNFVFSNKKCRERNQVFMNLSEYKRIDAPGTCMNNMSPILAGPEGSTIAKQRFLRNYKFTIAYENASSPGYTTEKIADAMAARSVPIYWGNPLVHLDFNPKAFLNRHDFDSDEAFIEHIIRVDQDDELYAKISSEPYWHNNSIPEAINDSTCLAFWEKVFASRRVMV